MDDWLPNVHMFFKITQNEEKKVAKDVELEEVEIDHHFPRPNLIAMEELVEDEGMREVTSVHAFANSVEMEGMVETKSFLEWKPMKQQTKELHSGEDDFSINGVQAMKGVEADEQKKMEKSRFATEIGLSSMLMKLPPSEPPKPPDPMTTSTTTAAKTTNARRKKQNGGECTSTTKLRVSKSPRKPLPPLEPPHSVTTTTIMAEMGTSSVFNIMTRKKGEGASKSYSQLLGQNFDSMGQAQLIKKRKDSNWRRRPY